MLLNGDNSQRAKDFRLSPQYRKGQRGRWRTQTGLGERKELGTSSSRIDDYQGLVIPILLSQPPRFAVVKRFESHLERWRVLL